MLLLIASPAGYSHTVVHVCLLNFYSGLCMFFVDDSGTCICIRSLKYEVGYSLINSLRRNYVIL
jgi:hypothetical protein